ncbi:fluoride efflux transporter CrcB [Exiguobacterium flavidum]|uniref:fluoride efflux transporter CrcB n=1 Tax=Exiguobacterium flavidum TaxID=2184695 RepID=UPI000DF7A27F|nr:fluoride efflux transporter CrcB [Exiguobacterium flavidum]
MSALAIAIGAFFGAISRFAINTFVKARTKTEFPFATLFVNVTGSFALGFLAGSEQGGLLMLALGTGFMGSFTTFSTFKLENLQFYQKRDERLLIGYLAASYSLGILAAVLGMWLGVHYIR